MDPAPAHNWLRLMDVLRDDVAQLEDIVIRLREAIDQIRASFRVIGQLAQIAQEADTRTTEL